VRRMQLNMMTEELLVTTTIVVNILCLMVMQWLKGKFRLGLPPVFTECNHYKKAK